CGADPAAPLDRVLGDARALGVAVLRDGAEAGLAAHDHHADGAVALAQVDAAHTLRGPADRGDLRFGEADRAALPRDQHDVVRAVRELDVEQAVALADAHGRDAAGTDAGELVERSALDDAAGAEEHEEPLGRELRDRDHRRDGGAAAEPEHADERLAAAVPRLGDLVHGQRVRLAVLREDEQRVARAGDERALEEVAALLRAEHGRAAAHAAAVERERHPVDVALVRERDDDVLLGDEVLDRELRIALHDAGAARVAVALDHLLELADKHRELALPAREQLLELGDAALERLELLLQRLVLERGEARQAHVQDRAGLRLGEAEPLA